MAGAGNGQIGRIGHGCTAEKSRPREAAGMMILKSFDQ
jgi:hypothetical protein